MATEYEGGGRDYQLITNETGIIRMLNVNVNVKCQC